MLGTLVCLPYLKEIGIEIEYDIGSCGSLKGFRDDGEDDILVHNLTQKLRTLRKISICFQYNSKTGYPRGKGHPINRVWILEGEWRKQSSISWSWESYD